MAVDRAQFEATHGFCDVDVWIKENNSRHAVAVKKHLTWAERVRGTDDEDGAELRDEDRVYMLVNPDDDVAAASQKVTIGEEKDVSDNRNRGIDHFYKQRIRPAIIRESRDQFAKWISDDADQGILSVTPNPADLQVLKDTTQNPEYATEDVRKVIHGQGTLSTGARADAPSASSSSASAGGERGPQAKDAAEKAMYVAAADRRRRSDGLQQFRERDNSTSTAYIGCLPKNFATSILIKFRGKLLPGGRLVSALQIGLVQRMTTAHTEFRVTELDGNIDESKDEDSASVSARRDREWLLEYMSRPGMFDELVAEGRKVLKC